MRWRFEPWPWVAACLRKIVTCRRLRETAEFLCSAMMGEDGRLLHAFRGGQAHLAGYVDDYAYTIEAFIALFEASGRARWIGRAVKLADVMLEFFQDQQVGGFFYTASDADKLITRNKEWHDGSLVSGNASAVMGLLKLSRLCDREDYRKVARAGIDGCRRRDGQNSRLPVQPYCRRSTATSTINPNSSWLSIQWSKSAD